MGQFSWIDCVSGEQILDGVPKTSYFLVPPEFEDRYGKRIEEHCYDGYGIFGGLDAYELVAIFNRDFLKGYKGNHQEKPVKERFCGFYDFEKDNLRASGLSEEEIQKKEDEIRTENYERALKDYEKERAVLKDFANGMTEDQLVEKYGLATGGANTYTRLIGIHIACYNEDNSELRYPIKVTYDPNVTYNSVGYSPRDPNQGWSAETDEDDDDFY